MAIIEKEIETLKENGIVWERITTYLLFGRYKICQIKEDYYRDR